MGPRHRHLRHGVLPRRLPANTAGWTTLTGSEVACSACHPAIPTSGDHSDHRSEGCDACHNTVVNTAGTAILLPSLHVNGAKNVSLKQGGSWNASTRSCTPSGCHGTETW